MKKISVLLFFLLPVLLSEGWVQAQSIGLRIPDTTAVQGAVLDMPLYVDSTLTGKNVYSYSFQLSYNPNYLQPESVVISGTISQSWGMPTVNTSVSGLITFAAAGTTPLVGKGKLVVLKWKVKNVGWTSLSFTDAKHNYLNEGSPDVILQWGSISIQPAPTITIYPDNSVIAKGDQLQMNAYDGTGPYTWSVTDNALAEINQEGMLTAKAAGFIKVVATDVLGVKDTTNYIEIRPIKLSIPLNLTQWEGATIDIPVLTSDLAGLNVSSGNFQLGFNANILSPVGIVQAGTLLESYQVFMHETQGSVSIAFAGSTTLSGMGTLVFVRFKVLSYPNGTSNIDIDQALMNENLLAAYSTGNFSVKNFESRYIYPSQGSLIIGESLELRVSSEAIPPYTWSVSDTTVATINQAGILTAKKGGSVQVSITDSIGAVAYSDKFKVFDTRVFIPDTAICQYDRLVEYPIYLESLPVGDSILSLQGEISFDNNQLHFSGIESMGTATQNFTYAVHDVNGKVTFAASSVTSLPHSGMLLKLNFIPQFGFGAGSWAGINLDNVMTNEGYPSVLVEKTGSISGVAKNAAYAQITAEPSDAICEGEVATFKVSVVNGGQPRYQWLKNGKDISGEYADTLRIATLTSNDTISCRVISTDPCVIDTLIYSNIINLIVNPLPLLPNGILGETLVIGGASDITYSVSDIPYADSYIWHLSPGVTGTSITNSISVSFIDAITSAVIKVQGVNGCGVGAMDSLIIKVTPTNVPTTLSENVLLYPNPFDKVLHIVLNNNVDRKAKMEVYNATGRLLKINNAQTADGITLDFSSQSSGVYLLKVSYKGQIRFYKLIKR